MAKCSVKNDCLGPTKSSRFDFNITDDNFEDLQAGYQPKTTICNTEWSAKVLIFKNPFQSKSITNSSGQ